MTKKEKEILHWILDRSWEKKANPRTIAAAIAELFPDDIKELNEELEYAKTNDCDCDKEKE